MVSSWGVAMRLLVLAMLLVLAGCDDDQTAARDMTVPRDLAARADIAMCVQHPAGTPGPCGPVTCAADEFCVKEQIGSPCADLAQPVDFGDGADAGFWDHCNQYACLKLPPGCACQPLCGPDGQTGPTGCLKALESCHYSTGC